MHSKLRLAPARVKAERRADGSTILRSPDKLAPPARCVTEWLLKWSDAAPERTFLAERRGGGLRTIPHPRTALSRRAAGRGLAHDRLPRNVRRRAAHRPGAARPEARPGKAGRDPLRQ